MTSANGQFVCSNSFQQFSIPTLPRLFSPLLCSCGGVVVTSADGKIVCSNTLDDRLRITYAQNLPAVGFEYLLRAFSYEMLGYQTVG